MDYEEVLNNDYLQYLQTPEWKKRHEQRLKIDGYQCQCCGSRGTRRNPLNVHHYNYLTKGNEDVYRDLVTLCRSCHAGMHNVLRRITSEDGSRMWDKHGKIPKVAVYSITGFDMNLIELGSSTETGD